MEQVGPQGGLAREKEGTSSVSFSEPHLSQRQLFREDLDMFPRGGGDGGAGEQAMDIGRPHVPPPALTPYKYHQQSLSSPGSISKEILKDILGQIAMEPVSRHGQFSGDFLGQSKLIEDEGHNQLQQDILPDGRYSKPLPKELFMKNLPGEPQLTNGNTQADILSRVGAPDYPDHAALPDMLSNHQDLGDFMHQHNYGSTSQKDDLHGLPQQGNEGGTSGWLPSTLSRLNLPSSDALISTSVNQPSQNARVVATAFSL